MIITIDGPSASGKSSVAQAVAQKLKIHHLQTGLLYRAVAFLLIKLRGHDIDHVGTLELFSKISPEELEAISRIVYDCSTLAPRVLIDGVDETKNLMKSCFDQPASLVSSIPAVRHKLLVMQRALAKKASFIADGRDCGSVVFPEAAFKFFLTAHTEVRAQRLLSDPKRALRNATLDTVRKSVLERDSRDQERSTAPLVVPQGAYVIDTTFLRLDEVIEKVLAVVGEE